jgi:pyruvate formate lyase activating enzyme
VGREATSQALLAEIEQDRPFYVGGGGATLSGGEPLWQPELALSLLGACRESRIGTVLDTSGFAPAAIAEQAAALADLVLLDIKHMDGAAHAREVGVDNRPILENAARMARLTRLRISLPVVPGFNDDEDNVRQTAELGCAIGAEAVDLNPMHQLGGGKYRALGIASPYDRFAAVDVERVQRLASVVRAVGLEVTVGRMM